MSNRQSILHYIMELWHQYRFLRFAKKQIKHDRNREYLLIQSDYRQKRGLSEEQLSDLWEEAFDNHYVNIMSGSRLRITAQGKDLIEFGLYGFIKTLINQHLAPVTWLAAAAAVTDFIYRLAHNHWKL